MMNQPLRIVFAGTPEFSVPALQALCNSAHTVCAVYTQPDRPAGRGRKLTASPVKQCALKHGCPVLQPPTLRDIAVQAELARWRADVMVVVAYGLILPPAVLALPSYGCINIHASLLPRWRGAAPIQRALLAGDKTTGITVMQMDAGLDTGDMLHCIDVPIGDCDTSPTLHDKLATTGALALDIVLQQLCAGELNPQVQDSVRATYAEKLHKREANIDWTRSAAQLHRQVRALLPWPVAETTWQRERLRIWTCAMGDFHSDAQPGTVLRADKNGIDIATGDGVLRLLEIQLPGGKALSAAEFLNAHNLDGAHFGESLAE